MTCDKCGQPFDPTEHPGALVFGPPLTLTFPTVRKLHLCAACVPDLEAWLGQSLR